MATTWIIAADDSRARVLRAERKGGLTLTEIDNLVNPAGRLQDRELQTDSAPRFNGHGGVGKPGTAPTGGTASDRETQGAVEHSVRVFARDLARYLERARTDRRYDELALIAPPKFLGMLRQELGKETEKLVTRELAKDISGFKTQDLAAYLREANT